MQVGDKILIGKTVRNKTAWKKAEIVAIYSKHMTVRYKNYLGSILLADVTSGQIEIWEDKTMPKAIERPSFEELKEMSKGCPSQNKATMKISEDLHISLATIQKWFAEYRKQGCDFGFNTQKWTSKEGSSESQNCPQNENTEVDNINTLPDEQKPNKAVLHGVEEMVEKGELKPFCEMITTCQLKRFHIKKDRKGLRLFRNDGDNFLRFTDLAELKELAEGLMLAVGYFEG